MGQNWHGEEARGGTPVVLKVRLLPSDWMAPP